MDESDDAYAFAITIQDCYANLDQIRVYVLTDRQAKAKNSSHVSEWQDRKTGGDGH